MVNAAAERRTAQLESQAVWVCHLMNVSGHLTTPMTVDKLLGRTPKRTPGLRERAVKRKAKGERVG